MIMNTENQAPKKLWIDKMSTRDATKVMLDNQEKSILSVQKALPQINIVVDKIFNILKENKKSRLIYAGAGTSIRIAVQDAVELYPTFGWPKNRIAFMIAGGEKAIINAVEGAEDDIKEPSNIGNKINVSNNDIVIALAASGETPFTLGCVRYAKLQNALSIGISNNKKGKILNESDYGIILDTGFEVIAGSTRLKAGTAQKICLNIISTMIMTKLGFVKNGLMTHFIASNRKLKKRKRKVLELMTKRK